MRRWSRPTIVTLAIVAVLLLALRIALPRIVLHYANRTLAEIPEYDARIADIDISLWRGAYQIEGLDIVKTDGEVPVPFFSCPEIDLSVEWRALFDGALVGEIDFHAPVVNLVAAPTEEETQAPVDERWQDTVQELFPLRVNRVEAYDGTIRYRNFHSTPKIDVPIDDLHVVATNLTNTRDLSKTLVAEISVEGRPLGEAFLDLDIEVDPYARKPSFVLDATLERVPVTKLNDFLRAYAGVDAQGGTLAVYAELEASDGSFSGYVKPLLFDLNVADINEKTEGPLDAAWEGLVELFSRLFRNLPRDQLGTRVELSGSFENPDYSVPALIGQALRNAFIDALSRGLEDDGEELAETARCCGGDDTVARGLASSARGERDGARPDARRMAASGT